MPDPYQRIPSDAELAGILALQSVPPVTTTRWNARRKAQVVRAVQMGLLTEAEVCRLYRMTAEELAGWQHALSEAGERGLRATKRLRPTWHDQRAATWETPRPPIYLQGSRLERAG